MNEKDLFRGIGEASDEAVEQAAPKPRPRRRWVPTVIAACLVLALGVGALGRFWPGRTPAADTGGSSTQTMSQADDQTLLAQLALCRAQYPEYPERVSEELLAQDSDAYQQATAAYYEQADAICAQQPDSGYLAGLQQFSMASTQQILSGAGTENRVYSPANLYMALAMLSEISSGDTRAELLNLLGTDSVETVRTQTEAIWRNLYRDDGVFMTRLANSLWLADGGQYQQQTLDTLQSSYFASAFSGQMGSEEYNAAIAAWVNEQTGNLLENEAAGIRTSDETALMLLSTLYFYEPWADSFDEAQTAPDTFTMADGTERTCDFMHDTREASYITGDGYRAATLDFAPSFTASADHRMIFILPDEGTDVDTLLSQGAVDAVLQAVALGQEQQSVELSIPKFAVSCDLDLTQSLQALGVTQAFGDSADFSSLIQTDTPVSLSTARQAAIVRVDENGCEAASYVNLMLEMAMELPEEQTPTLTLDRPFLFVITGLDGLSLYTGVVNNPLQAA